MVSCNRRKLQQQELQIQAVAAVAVSAHDGGRRFRYSNRKVCNLTKGIICPRIM
jgi:hypothetical protein